MKMKFRADPKDIGIFLAFSLILLLLICLAVANIGMFISEGEFTGLNFIPALTKYLPLTIMLFIIAIIAMFMSVQSWFIEREEGMGFQIGEKKEKNYSRWAKEKEIAKDNGVVAVDPKANKINAAGIPLSMKPNMVLVDNGEYHNLVIGSTGAGKTQTTVLPMVNLLAKHDESMIVTDPKGEIYEQTSELLRSLGYNIVLLNFRDPQQGNMWNPLYLPYSLYSAGNVDKATELLDDLALNILYDESSKGQDPFWEKTSADYFAGLSLGLFADATADEINLNSISLMTTVGEEKLANTTYVKEYFSFKDPTSTAYVNASSTLMAPNETKGSILSVFKQKIKLFSSRENLSEMLSNNDFDMRDIGKKKTAVFIVIQDEKKTYHSLVTIFLKQCYETLISVAQESGGKLPHRTNFILDEFANMPPLKDVTTMVTAARSRGMRFTFIIQNFAQLYEVYGKENGETIKGNCGNIVYLISTEISALEEISKMCGEVKSKEKEKTTSTPLVTVSDLQRMKQWDTLILRLRMMPFKTTLTPNYKMDWGTNFPKAKYPVREKQPVHIFDLKSFVEKKREEKINNLLGGAGVGGSSPMGGGNSPFPGGNPPFPPVPYGAGTPTNPFSANPLPPNGTMNMNNQPAPQPPKPAGGINVEDLVKRIDAKIAELEEEEKQEKEKLATQQPTPQASVGPQPIFHPLPNPVAPTQPQVENVTDKKDKPGVSDDQFFDDFFGDD
jgi:Type IV secretory pathway, VirD4 components